MKIWNQTLVHENSHASKGGSYIATDKRKFSKTSPLIFHLQNTNFLNVPCKVKQGISQSDVPQHRFGPCTATWRFYKAITPFSLF